MTLKELEGKWVGTSELWLDPLGNAVHSCDCTLTVEASVIRYTWSHEGKDHEGSYTLTDEGADFTDTWHQPTPMPCRTIEGSWALLDVRGTYAAGDGSPDWGWRTTVSHRTPTGELVLQMTNVTPWGEHGRAVRMTVKRADG